MALAVRHIWTCVIAVSPYHWCHKMSHKTDTLIIVDSVMWHSSCHVFATVLVFKVIFTEVFLNSNTSIVVVFFKSWSPTLNECNLLPRITYSCRWLKIFLVILFPDEGYYQSGRFQFEIDVPEAYNMVVSSQVSLLWAGLKSTFLCPWVSLC